MNPPKCWHPIHFWPTIFFESSKILIPKYFDPPKKICHSFFWSITNLNPPIFWLFKKCYNPKMLTTHKNDPLNIWTTQFFYPQNILKIFWPSKCWPPKELLYQQNVLIQFSFPFLLKFILSRVPILFSKPSYGNPIGWFWKIQSHNFPPKNRPNLHCICLSLHLWTTTIFNIENMWLF